MFRDLGWCNSSRARAPQFPWRGARTPPLGRYFATSFIESPNDQSLARRSVIVKFRRKSVSKSESPVKSSQQ